MKIYTRYMLDNDRGIAVMTVLRDIPSEGWARAVDITEGSQNSSFDFGMDMGYDDDFDSEPDLEVKSNLIPVWELIPAGVNPASSDELLADYEALRLSSVSF